MDAQKHKNIKMLIELGEYGYEVIMAYTELCDSIEDQHDDEFKDPERRWVCKDILGHQGPLKNGDPGYIGCPWNVEIIWKNDTTPMEPLKSVAKDDPVSWARYAKKHGLLNTEG
jgi:hypothetical protein